MAVEGRLEREPRHFSADVREELLRMVPFGAVAAAILADEDGIVSGMSAAKREAEKLGLSPEEALPDGGHARRGEAVLRFSGIPKQIVMAEEILIGLLAKPSGIATSARRFVQAAGERPTIVCGAWKKMPPAMKEMIRGAVTAGGASPRIVPGPFAYLDKNYIELLGGIRKGIEAAARLEGHAKVVQIKGRYGDIAAEACEAAEAGADVVFIDTGRPEDIRFVSGRLVRRGLRGRVKLAFGGGVDLGDVDRLKSMDLDILDVGRRIVDAPLLDMRMEIVDRTAEERDSAK